MSPKLARRRLFIDLLEITLRSRCTAKDLCYKNVCFIILKKINARLNMDQIKKIEIDL